MKKRLKNKYYDTEKATLYLEWSNGLPEDDPSWKSETLYQMKRGEFFLHVRGGWRACYSPDAEDSAEYIAPITYETAKEWARKHMEPEQFDDAFGIINNETTKKERLYLTVDAPVLKILKREASKRGVTLSNLISDMALSAYQENPDPRGGTKN